MVALVIINYEAFERIRAAKELLSMNYRHAITQKPMAYPPLFDFLLSPLILIFKDGILAYRLLTIMLASLTFFLLKKKGIKGILAFLSVPLFFSYLLSPLPEYLAILMVLLYLERSSSLILALLPFVHFRTTLFLLTFLLLSKRKREALILSVASLPLILWHAMTQRIGPVQNPWLKSNEIMLLGPLSLLLSLKGMKSLERKLFLSSILLTVLFYLTSSPFPLRNLRYASIPIFLSLSRQSPLILAPLIFQALPFIPTTSPDFKALEACNGRVVLATYQDSFWVSLKARPLIGPYMEVVPKASLRLRLAWEFYEKGNKEVFKRYHIDCFLSESCDKVLSSGFRLKACLPEKIEEKKG